MHTLIIDGLVVFVVSVIAFLFRFTVICGVDDLSPAEAMQQEWADLKGKWAWIRSLRHPGFRRRGAERPRHAKAAA